MNKNNKRIPIIMFLLLLVPINALTKGEVLAIKGGEIHTVSGSVIKKGTVLIEEGKILAVGKSISVPRGAKVIDAKGLIITPGIIDARSSLGIKMRRDSKNYINPALRIVDFFTQPKVSPWLECGVTATYITPPSQNLISGFGAVVKLAGIKEEAVVSEEAGMSVSIGESALEGNGVPTTRQGRVGRLRQELVRAVEYMELRKKGGSAENIDPNLEAIIRVIRREVPLRFLANTPDDIMTAIRVAKEFNLRVVIDSGAGAHRVAHLLAEAQVPVVVGPSIMGLGSGGPLEMFAHTPENAGKLQKAGVKVALCTNSRWGRSVLLEGVVAKSHGLPEDASLKAVTLNAAEILGVADRLGSIEQSASFNVASSVPERSILERVRI